MATYKLTQTFSDGTTKDINFTIPEVAGTYKLKFTLSDSTVIDAGNVVVGTTPSTYKINLAMADGSNVSANFLVPSIGYKVTIPARQKGISALQYRYTDPNGNTAYANAGTSQTSIQVKNGSTVTVYAHTLSDTTNYQVWSGNTTSWTINANTTLPAYHAQYKTFPSSYGCTANSGTSITMAYEPKLTAGLRLYKNGNVAATASAQSSVASLTAGGLTNGTEYTFTATHYDSTGQVKEGPHSSGIIVKAWSTTTTYNVTFPALDKAYGVGQQTWTYYNNMGVKSTRVAALSDSGYSGDTKAATIAVRSGLTVAITDTKYYSNIANYVEPSEYMGSSGKETNWTITRATTVNQMFTQWKVSPAVFVTKVNKRNVEFRATNNLSIPAKISYRAEVTDGDIRDAQFMTTGASVPVNSTITLTQYDMMPGTQH